MREYEFVTLDVFTERRFGGNPLAVFPSADGLSDAEMQAIAAEFNLSETSFVLPPADPRHTACVRVFTPRSEHPFAGHPNVGTGFVLARRLDSVPDHFVFEEMAGLVRVYVERDGAGAVVGARIDAPRPLSIGAAVPVGMVAACAGLQPDELSTAAHDPVVASVGVPVVIAEVANLDVLSRATPSARDFRDTLASLPELGKRLTVHLYAKRGDGSARLRSRVFAPLEGIPEDPATGSANVTLAALLTFLDPARNIQHTFDIEQGAEMGRPSRLFASAVKNDTGQVTATIGGRCVQIMRGVLQL
jgi:trans-2,3-dihydro-3-hydroxyanthranilate isomerase